MKKNNFIYSIITVTFLIAGSVSAYTEPSGAFPNGNVDPVVDVSVQKQEKTGPFWARFLKGGLQDLVSGTGDVTEFFIGDKAAMAVQGFFTYVFLPGPKSQLRVGDANGGDGTRNTLFTYIIDKYPAVTTIMNTNRAPVTVDLAGRGTSAGDAEGREALALLSDTNYCSSSVVTNTSAISLLNDISKTPADLLARQVQLSGGEPARNKVLVATDTDGNAVWGTISIANGQVVVNYDGAKSPVKAGQEICGVPPVDPEDNININFKGKRTDGAWVAQHLCGLGSRQGFTPVDLTFTDDKGAIIDNFDSVSFEVKLTNQTLAEFRAPGGRYDCLIKAGLPQAANSLYSDKKVTFQNFDFVPINHPLTQQVNLNKVKLINNFRKTGPGKYYVEIAQNLTEPQGGKPFDVTIRAIAVYKGKTFTKDVIIGKNKMVVESPNNPSILPAATIMPEAEKICYNTSPNDHFPTFCAQVRNP